MLFWLNNYVKTVSLAMHKKGMLYTETSTCAYRMQHILSVCSFSDSYISPMDKDHCKLMKLKVLRVVPYLKKV